MSIYNETDELAKKFDAAYPDELSARLEWWCKALGIDRTRLLPMIGCQRNRPGRGRARI